MKTSWLGLLLTCLFMAMFFCMAFAQVVLLSETNPAYGHLTGVYSLLGLFAGAVGSLLWAQGRRIEELERKCSGRQ
jgi:hypothetical protein